MICNFSPMFNYVFSSVNIVICLTVIGFPHNTKAQIQQT